MAEFTPELQARFTNEMLNEFGRGLDQVLRARLAAISGNVPSQTVQLIRYQIMEASASDISAKYELYLQDSGRISEMRNINQKKRVPVEEIIAWIENGRRNIIRNVPGYQRIDNQLSERKQIERVAWAIARSKIGQQRRRGAKLKGRQWLNKNIYGWYGRLVQDFIRKQPEYLEQMIKSLVEPLQKLEIVA